MITSLDNGTTDNSRLYIHFYYSYLPERKKKKRNDKLFGKNVIEERTKHPFTYFTLFTCKSCIIQKSIKKKNKLNFLNQKVFIIILKIFTNHRTSQRNHK